MSNIIRGMSTRNTTMNNINPSNTSDSIKSNEISSSNFSNILNQNIANRFNVARNVPLGLNSILSSNTNTNSSKSESISNSSNEIISNNNVINIENNIDNNIDNNNTSKEFRVDIKAKDSDTKNRIANAVKKASSKYGVDPNLILAVIQTESYFNPKTTSKTGAVGLMQIMPDNFKHLGVTNGYNIEENVNAGTKLLKEYIDRYNGNIEMALMAYNGGPTRMANRGVKSPDDLYKMPKETQNYVPKVMDIYRGA